MKPTIQATKCPIWHLFIFQDTNRSEAMLINLIN